MRGDGQGQDTVWSFKAADQVQCVAASGAAGWSLVADKARGIYVLNEAGSSRGVFRAGQPVRRLRADPQGGLMSALGGDTIIYAFNVQAQLEWRVELGGPVTDFDFDTAAEQLAAVSAGGWLYLYSPESRERRVVPVGWPMTSVGMAGVGPVRIAVCNDKGRVALLSADGKPEWEKDLGGRTGGLSVSVGGDMIVVASQELGLVMFRLNGEEIGRFQVGQPVLRAEVISTGALIMAETARDRLVLARPDTTVVWEQSFGGPLAGWAVAAGGRIAVVATGGREVLACRTGQGGPARAPLAERSQEAPLKAPGLHAGASGAAASAKDLPVSPPEGPPEIEEIEWPDYIEVETAVAGRRAKGAAPKAGPSARPATTSKPAASPKPAAGEGPTAPAELGVAPHAAAVPTPAAALTPADSPKPAASPKLAPPAKAPERVAWKVRVPDRGLPVQESLFRLSEDGALLAMGLADGTVMALDAKGKVLVRAQVEGPARLAPRTLRGLVAVWTAHRLLVVEPAAEAARTVPFSGGPVRFFDCAADLSLYCTVDEKGTVSAFREADAPVWQRESKATPTGVFVSPSGGTVLVCDAEGRFIYYDRDGGQVRKFRFGADERLEALGLGDSISVFVSAEGRLTVLDAEGRRIWSRRPFAQVTGIELLGEALAVYGPAGACAHIDPHRETAWEMLPPPGRVRLRKPQKSDPCVIHASGSVVTVFRGYRRKLDVVWRRDCGEEISALDAEANGHAIVALAGPKVYRIEGTGPA